MNLCASPLGLMDLNPFGFQSQIFGNLSLSYRTDIGYKSAMRNSSFVSSFSIVGCHAMGGFYNKMVYQGIFLTHLDVALCSFAEVKELLSLFSGIYIFPEEIVLYVAVDFMCPWEKVSSGYSYVAI